MEKQGIIYTAHAINRMAVRGITKEMVRNTLHEPEQTGIGYEGKRLAYKHFGDKRIKVVYTRETNRFVIITVIWD